MRIELFNVEIPADHSRFFNHIPLYEIAILEFHWAGNEELRSKVTDTSPSGFIVASAGLIEELDEATEWARLNQTYPPTMLAPDGTNVLLRSVYPSQAAFRSAFKAGEYRPELPPHAVLRGMAEARALAEATPVPVDDEADDDEAAATAEEKPKNKGGRPRKVVPVPVDDEAMRG
jgi:hypothetical protein